MTLQSDATSDEALTEAARAGDDTAFAALWARHSAAAASAARGITSRFDAEDLVAESYTRILAAIRRGGGPTGAFRPYLFTTIRNIARSWSHTPTTVAVEEWELESADEYSDPENTALTKTLTVSAFRSLPENWQTVLWYTAVEGMDPHEVAPLLGMTPNGVAALALRAREGLRQSWIRSHVNDRGAGPECRWTIDKLGSYARGTLGPRARKRLEAHLAECTKCLIASEEASEVAARLAVVLLPIVLGGAPGLAYLASTGSAAAATTASGMAAPTAAPVPVPGAEAGAGGAAAGAASAASGSMLGWVVAAAVVVATAGGATGILAATGVFSEQTPPDTPVTAPVEPEASEDDESDESTRDETAAEADVPSAEDAPPGLPLPEAETVVRPSTPNTGTPSTPPRPLVPAPELAPVVLSPLAGQLGNDARPVITGTGAPGAVVRIRLAGATVASTTIGGDGAWSAQPADPLPEGELLLTISQGTSGGESPRSELPLRIDTIAPLAAETLWEVDPERIRLPYLSLVGEAGSTAQLLQGDAVLVSRVLDDSGTWDAGQIWLRAGTAQLSVRLVDPAGNVSEVVRLGDVVLESHIAILDPLPGTRPAWQQFPLVVEGPGGGTVQVLIRHTTYGTEPDHPPLTDTGWLTARDVTNGDSDYFTIAPDGRLDLSVGGRAQGTLEIAVRPIDLSDPRRPLGVHEYTTVILE